MFSGGGYDEVGRWLWNFLTSHAKRENPRAEVLIESGDEREGVSYGARFRLDDRASPLVDFEFDEVARERGTLAWCAAVATRARRQVRELAGAPGVVTPPSK